MPQTGRIHSIESLGTLDGPGLRTVVFLQGCPLRCAYCHNPDTWSFSGGEDISAAQLVQRLLRFAPYWGETGGVTLSGGEPLAQGAFTAQLLALLAAEGIHTTLDTSCIGADTTAPAILKNTRLLLADIKFPTAEPFRRHCGGNLAEALSFLRLSEKTGVPLWVRHVAVPGLSDSPEHLRQIARLAGSFATLQKLELLPFKKMCLPKYAALGIPFPLAATPEMPGETLATLQAMVDSFLA